MLDAYLYQIMVSLLPLGKGQVLLDLIIKKINKNFIDWDRISIPTEVNRLGPKHIERISERDKHPSEKGQQQIARLIYDGLG